MSRRTIPAGLISVGVQRVAPNSTAAALLNTTCSISGGTFLICVETQSARLTFDGTTNPTTNTGILFTAANSPYYFEGLDGSKIKVRAQTAGSIINVQAWRRP